MTACDCDRKPDVGHKAWCAVSQSAQFEDIRQKRDALRKRVDDQIYAEIRAARPDLYELVVAMTAGIGDSYRRAQPDSDYYCERTLMGLVHKVLAL